MVIWTFLSVACTDLLVIYRITTLFWTSVVYVGFGKLLVFESRSYDSLTRRPIVCFMHASKFGSAPVGVRCLKSSAGFWSPARLFDVTTEIVQV